MGYLEEVRRYVESGLLDSEEVDYKLAIERRLQEARRAVLEDDENCLDLVVGDAKYKRVKHAHVPNADLYQLLAYTTALDLPGGLLIYAEGEANDVVHRKSAA